jgi:hypothetical protein
MINDKTSAGSSREIPAAEGGASSAHGWSRDGSTSDQFEVRTAVAPRIRQANAARVPRKCQGARVKCVTGDVHKLNVSVLRIVAISREVLTCCLRIQVS